MIQNLKNTSSFVQIRPLPFCFFCLTWHKNPPWKLNTKGGLSLYWQRRLGGSSWPFQHVQPPNFEKKHQSSGRAWKVGEHSGNSRRPCIYLHHFLFALKAVSEVLSRFGHASLRLHVYITKHNPTPQTTPVPQQVLIILLDISGGEALKNT